MSKFLTVLLLLISLNSFCQVAGVSINPSGTPPASSAILDVNSPNKGLLMPRLSQVQRDSIVAPAFGLMILNTTSNCINIWLGTAWQKFCSTCDFDNPVPGNNGPICVGDSLRLTASNIAGASYHWTGPNSFSSTQQNPVIPNAGNTASGVYSVVATLNGCSSQPQSTVVTINNAATPTATNNGPLCAGQNLVITASAISGAIYNWSGPNFSANTQSVTLSNVTGANAGVYNVVAAVNGCLSDTGSTTAIIYSSSPAQPGSITGSTTNIGGAVNVTYSISAVSLATSYAWTVPFGASITSGQGDTTITVTFGCNAGGGIGVTASNPCGVSPQTTLSVSSSFVTPDSISGPTSISTGATAVYSINPIANAISYTWTSSIGVITAGQGTTSITVTCDTPGVGTISVVENTSCGSSAPKILTVYVNTHLLSVTGTLNTGSFQTFNVPNGVTLLTVDAYGAQGGSGNGGYGASNYGCNCSAPGGLGAHIKGSFNVTPGDVIRVLVGQAGGGFGGPHGNENGGGGGSFVVNLTTSTLLVVAGGGGGGPSLNYGSGCTRNPADGNGQAGNNGATPVCTNCGCGSGAGGSGGSGGSTSGSYEGGGGGGYTGNGSSGGTHCSTAGGGQSYTNGGTGGLGNTCYDGTGGYNNSGGFGGGGGGMLGGPGAGGGYSGGGTVGNWSTYSTWGGGGGSYNTGINQTNVSGVQSGHGQVYFSW